LPIATGGDLDGAVAIADRVYGVLQPTMFAAAVHNELRLCRCGGQQRRSGSAKQELHRQSPFPKVWRPRALKSMTDPRLTHRLAQCGTISRGSA
jgi:hypothetical protein